MTKHFGKNFILTLSLLLPTTILADFTITVDVQKRIEPLKRIIDFYCINVGVDSARGIMKLKPRYVAQCGIGTGTMNNEVRTMKMGLTPVCNLGRKTSRTDVRNAVSNAKQYGIKYYQLWTEPNRTWGPRYLNNDNWLRTVTWGSFCTTAVEMHHGVMEADSSAILSGPVVTGDHKNDPSWFFHITEYLLALANANCKLSYVSFNPPWDPEQVYQVSNLAKNFSTAFPKLGIKGISLGEYPFYLNSPSVHVRFFIAFEEAWNCIYAAKSHFSEGTTNSGLVMGDTAIRPVYWTFYKYGRMQGARLGVTGSEDRKVNALASYDSTARKLYILAANDTKADSSINLTLQHVTGDATMRVGKFTRDSTIWIDQKSLSSNGDSMVCKLPTIPAEDAFYIEIDFSEQQIVKTTNNQFSIYKGDMDQQVPAIYPKINLGKKSNLVLFEKSNGNLLLSGKKIVKNQK